MQTRQGEAVAAQGSLWPCLVTAALCEQLFLSLQLTEAGFLPPGRPECCGVWGGGRGASHLSPGTAGLDCSARPCSWELDSRFALTDASWAVPLCWTLFFVTGLPAGSRVNTGCARGLCSRRGGGRYLVDEASGMPVGALAGGWLGCSLLSPRKHH